MAAPVLIIAGSARDGGNTAAAVDHLCNCLDGQGQQIINLNSLRLEPFRYGRIAADDFSMIVGRMIEHRQIVLATPVYWYAMSGLMKIFFDRLTDLLREAAGEQIGRALAGRELWLLATGADDTLPEGFIEPFARTAEYFAMSWRDAFYVRMNKDAPPGEQDLTVIDDLAAALRE
jgi:multimeric flavodoxin WrbA